MLGYPVKLEKNLGPLPGGPTGQPPSEFTENNDAEIIAPVELESVARAENLPQLL